MSRIIKQTVAVVVILAVFYVWLRYQFSDAPAFYVQAAWTMLGLFGAIVTAANLRDAIKDRIALVVMGRNGDLRFMADNSLWVESLRLAKMVTILVIGVVALSAQPLLTGAQRKALHIPLWTTTGIVITAGLALIVVVTITQAVLDRYVRHRFYGGIGQ